MDPVLGREVVKRQQLGLVIDDLLDRFGQLRAVLLGERGDDLGRVLAVLGVVDVLDGLLRRGLGRLREVCIDHTLEEDKTVEYLTAANNIAAQRGAKVPSDFWSRPRQHLRRRACSPMRQQP
jgi:hypothetical protein